MPLPCSALLHSLAMAQLDERLLNVDSHGCVRIPGALWLAMAFLARYFIIAVGVVFSRSQDLMQVAFRNELVWVVLFLELPAVALMLAGANRDGTGARVWRAVWSYGRGSVTALVVLHVLYAAWMLWTSEVWHPWPELLLASCALLDIAIAYGVRTDPFFAQLFSEFPASTVN